MAEKKDLEARVREKPHVTKEYIKVALQQLGLGQGDNVGVHSSLSSFGYVRPTERAEDKSIIQDMLRDKSYEGQSKERIASKVRGANTVIDTLLETVEEEGTVVFPTYSNNIEWLELTEEDKELGVTGKRRYLPYNPEKDSCWTGIIPDVFWRREEAVRGPNPTHSLSAIGPKAEELSQGWDKLLENEGYILLLGVTLGNCSSMHLAEGQAPQLGQYKKEAPQPSRPLKELTQEYEDEGIRVNVEYPGKLSYPHFERMEEPCKEHGVMKTTEIGEATIKLFKLRELIDLYAEYLREDPDMFYHD